MKGTKTGTAADFFKESSYVVLNEVLSKELCQNLTEHMFKLYEDGKTTKDEQCPLSEAIYGDERFDAILGQLADPVGQHIGIKLLPTYTYARLYRPGEVLEPHVDRPACEISGTMTLGYDGIAAWPIFLSANGTEDESPTRADLGIGELLIYRGEELYHWREEFKGEWQVQVFFHFVDANGEHASEAMDGRPELGLNRHNMPNEEVEKKPAKKKAAKKPAKKKAAKKNSTKSEELPDIAPPHRTILPHKEQSRPGIFPIYGGVMIPSWDLMLPGMITYVREQYPGLTFTEEECEGIIGLASSAYLAEGTVGNDEVSTNVRKVNLYQLPLVEKTKWLFDRLARVASMANNEYYDYEIMGITHELQLLHYESGGEPGHYDWHQDMGGSHMSTRKISMVVQLSDPDTYTGGSLQVNDNGTIIAGAGQKGSITCFPSYAQHRVTPMETGERWSLVIWVHGSKRFR